MDIIEEFSTTENTLIDLENSLDSSDTSIQFSSEDPEINLEESLPADSTSPDEIIITENSDLETISEESETSEDGSDSVTGENPDDSETLDDSEVASSEFDSGVFTVGEDGEIEIDFLFDGGKYKGELALFSLEGLDEEPGSEAFIQEAAARALSSSELGHIVISDSAEGARFTGILEGYEDEDWNKGEYLGIKGFEMTPGDEFGFMFIPNGTVEEVLENPDVEGSKRPLFSMTAVDSEDIYGLGTMIDVTGDRNSFGFDDQWGDPDGDYNDLVFQVDGATGTVEALTSLIEPENDWRNAEPGQELIQSVVDPLDLAGNTPDEARQSLPSTNGVTYRGWVGSADTDDYYSFSLGMSNEFNLSLDGLWTDANVEVLDFEGNVVLSSANSGITAESISGTLEHGAYRIRVTNIGDVGTPYDLNLSVIPTIEGITTTGSDAPVFITTDVSNTLINLDDFKSGDPLKDSRPEFAGIDGSGFSTVIIDSGIDLDHPFFGVDSNDDNDDVADRISYNYDFADTNELTAEDIPNNIPRGGHGTHVSSIVASQDNVFPGIAPGADIIALKVFRVGTDQNGQPAMDGNFGWTEQALQWVLDNAETYNIASVNMSLGDVVGDVDSDGNNDYGNYNTPQALYAIDDELAALAAKGVIVVSASGNSFNTYSTQGVAYPAADPNSLSVGSVGDGSNGTTADQISGFSQRDANLTDIFAPGQWITAANVGGGTTEKQGTSMAAPHIAGMAVLAQQLAQQELGRLLSPSEFRQLLYDTGEPINDPVTGVTSFRRADMLALANEIAPPPPDDGTITVEVSIPGIIGFQPPNTRGDKEFAGNGPLINIQAEAVPQGTTLQVFGNASFTETEPDFTTFGGSFSSSIVDINSLYPGFVIDSIVRGGGLDILNTTDVGLHDTQVIFQDGNDLVARYDIQGDTRQRGLFNRGSDEPFVSISFNPVKARLRSLTTGELIEDTFFLPATTFEPPRVDGDDEFDGNGPRIEVLTEVIADGSLLKPIVSAVFEEWENGAPKIDYTTFAGVQEGAVVDVGQRYPGYVIDEILSDRRDVLETVDVRLVDPQTISLDNDELVREYQIEGDSDGDDQPFVNIFFNPVVLKLRPA